MKFYVEIQNGEIAQRAYCPENPYGEAGMEVTSEIFSDQRRLKLEDGVFVPIEVPGPVNELANQAERIAELEAMILQQQEVIDAMLNGGGAA